MKTNGQDNSFRPTVPSRRQDAAPTAKEGFYAQVKDKVLSFVHGRSKRDELSDIFENVQDLFAASHPEHPDDGVFTLYLEGLSDEDEASKIETHLAGCASCRKVAASYVQIGNSLVAEAAPNPAATQAKQTSSSPAKPGIVETWQIAVELFGEGLRALSLSPAFSARGCRQGEPSALGPKDGAPQNGALACTQSFKKCDVRAEMFMGTPGYCSLALHVYRPGTTIPLSGIEAWITGAMNRETRDDGGTIVFTDLMPSKYVVKLVMGRKGIAIIDLCLTQSSLNPTSP